MIYRTGVAIATVAALSAVLLACSDDTVANPGSDATDGSMSDSANDATGDGTDVADTSDDSDDVTADLGEPDTSDIGDDDAVDDDVVGDASDDGDAGTDDAASDSGSDALSDVAGDLALDGDAAGDVVCGGRAGNTCARDEYCDFPDDICGAADAPGVCRTRPEFCTRDYRPVCGCDGTVYGNACSANASGNDVNATGGCTAPEGWTACGFGFCYQQLPAYCRKTIPGRPEAQISYECVDLPASCGETATCECVADEPCGNECTVQGDGGLLVTCLGA